MMIILTLLQQYLEERKALIAEHEKKLSSLEQANFELQKKIKNIEGEHDKAMTRYHHHHHHYLYYAIIIIITIIIRAIKKFEKEKFDLMIKNKSLEENIVDMVNRMQGTYYFYYYHYYLYYYYYYYYY